MPNNAFKNRVLMVRDKNLHVSRADPILAQGDDLVLKPLLEALLIGDRDWTKPEKGSDLLAVALTAPPLQVVVEPSRWRGGQLFAHERQHGAWNILVAMGKTTVELEEFEQNRDADTPPFCTVGEESPLSCAEGPMLDQLLLVPTSLHCATAF